MTTPPPLTRARFLALRAAVCEPHLNQAGLLFLGIDTEAYNEYVTWRGSRSHLAWLEKQTAWMWREFKELRRHETWGGCCP
jgi:hypothetical protein